MNEDEATVCARVSAPSAPTVKTSITPGMIEKVWKSNVPRELTNTERASRSTSSPVVAARTATA